MLTNSRSIQQMRASTFSELVFDGVYPLKIFIFIFYCAYKKSGIKSRAKAYVYVTVLEVEGEPDVNTLVRIHTPEMHNHIMCLTTLAIYVRVCRSIIGKMLAEIAKNPCSKIGMFFYICS